MDYQIEVRREKERGCGRRKPGGLYIVAGSGFFNCGKLPIPLSNCPCCGAGIKPARGWTWVGKAITEKKCSKLSHQCIDCAPFDGSVERMGLLWVGEKFYKTPEDFMKESMDMGISRRLAHIPKDFVLGETWVLMAHQHTTIVNTYDTPDCKGEPKPGKLKSPRIFMAFKPERIEYVVKVDDPPEKLERMAKQGITLVRVVPEELPEQYI